LTLKIRGQRVMLDFGTQEIATKFSIFAKETKI